MREAVIRSKHGAFAPQLDAAVHVAEERPSTSVGSYVVTANTTLHADLGNCPHGGHVIGADKVTLDLNRHTIAGDLVTEAIRGDDCACGSGIAAEGGTRNLIERDAGTDGIGVATPWRCRDRQGHPGGREPRDRLRPSTASPRPRSPAISPCTTRASGSTPCPV